MTPKISVILPVYNGARFIKRSIDSVLSQKFYDLELIIINDCSTDRTEQIVQNFLEDPRVIYLKNQTNLGIIKTLNKGLSIAKGKYIARIDDDDEWIDEYKLTKQYRKLEENPRLALIGSNVRLVDLSSGIKKDTNLPSSDRQIRRYLILNNQFLHTAVLFRKKALSKVGKYRDIEEAKYVEDYDLWLRIASKYLVENLQDVSTLVRLDQKRESASNFYRQKLNGFKIASQFAKNFPRGEINLIIRSLRLVIPKNMAYFLRSRL